MVWMSIQIFPNIKVTENKNCNSKGFRKLCFNICFIKYDSGIHPSQDNRQAVKNKSFHN